MVAPLTNQAVDDAGLDFAGRLTARLALLAANLVMILKYPLPFQLALHHHESTDDSHARRAHEWNLGWRKLHDLAQQDRKSTRLNSSHVRTSYAVFCLKKKNLSDGLARLPDP